MSSITKESYHAGDFIFFEGDIEAHFYIIESGSVSIFTKNSTTGQKVSLATLNPGDTFGEFALIDSGARTASAMAETDVKLMKISQEGYDIMLNELPLWASSMLKSFSDRLKTMNAQIKGKK
jgi:CRP/FNR family transcriptional regulator, cyclic AMP receptor protein